MYNVQFTMYNLQCTINNVNCGKQVAKQTISELNKANVNG